MKAVAVILLALAVCASAAAPKTWRPPRPMPRPGPSVYDLITALAALPFSEFTIMKAAVDAANPWLIAQLKDPNLRATVFVPNDAAFARLLTVKGVSPANLLANQNLVTKLLQNHVIGGVAIPAKAIPTGPVKLQTLANIPSKMPGAPNQGEISIRKGSAGNVRVGSTGNNIEATVYLVDLYSNRRRAVLHAIKDTALSYRAFPRWP